MGHLEKFLLLPHAPQFTGRQFDPETGLYYYRSRYYAPQAGRFTTADPIGLLGGPNLYAYVRNNPTNLIDPWGLKSGKGGGKKQGQVSIGVGGIIGGIGPFLGPFLTGSVTIGVTSSGQVFIQFQGGVLVGIGLFAGVGTQAGVSGGEPVPNGWSQSAGIQGQINGGWGASGGIAGTVGMDGVSVDSDVGKFGVGYGIMAAGGIVWTGTLASRPIPDIILDLLRLLGQAQGGNVGQGTPEPATVVLAGAGLAMISAYKMKRRRHRK